ncbi:hypothetical protein Pmani_002172 [Petrolisthes manimaculis]|uniref:Mutator-like transposase domain-containing protein n=1 Tax=Petrolisthes manimaculis TaxID=1843537 RepID=A0AAE1QJ37_9EUCA|nr:hypothetical protein Pmani_002172 [Petrolisthes manimaculis]
MSRSKQQHGLHRREEKKTGGGASPPDIPKDVEKVLSLIAPEADPDDPEPVNLPANQSEGLATAPPGPSKDTPLSVREKPSGSTRKRRGGMERYEVHRRAVEAGLHCGDGYVAVQKFCMAMNMPMIHQKTFSKHKKDIIDNSIKKHEELLEQTRKQVHLTLEEKDPTLPEVKEVTVTLDGSWGKRGFTAKYGFVSAIEYETGMVVDHVTLSKWCKFCAIEEGKGRDRKEWWPEHASECNKNFDGSNPAMEMEGWKILFGRSVENCKMKYVRVVSDGDSKGYKAVKAMKPYGDGVEIKKEECTNHVAKRIGKALLKLKQGGRKAGSLTAVSVKKLQNYFTQAIKNHIGDEEEMKKAIYATLRHCASTDQRPQHSTCQSGKDSWCFVQRAIANDQPIPQHKDHIHTPLRQDVVAKMMPVYQRIVTPQLLEGCKGGTQNSNESLHSIIWSELPKTKFFGLKRMLYGVHRGITKFNLGYSAAEVEGSGWVATKVAKDKDNARVYNAKRMMECKDERKRKKIKAIHDEEKKKKTEGTTYEAGCAALPT